METGRFHTIICISEASQARPLPRASQAHESINTLFAEASESWVQQKEYLWTHVPESINTLFAEASESWVSIMATISIRAVQVLRP